MVALKDGWMRVWIGMTGGMDKHWGEKELPRVGHQLASCSLLISYFLSGLQVGAKLAFMKYFIL